MTVARTAEGPEPAAVEPGTGGSTSSRQWAPSTDGGVVFGKLRGTGSYGVVLVHGGRFRKGSGEDKARRLEEAEYLVLAFDFRCVETGECQAPSSPTPSFRAEVAP